MNPPQCKPSVTTDHNAGDKATSVTVTVRYTCTGEVYDYEGALSLAAQLLIQQAANQLGSGYIPVRNIVTTLTSAEITDSQHGTAIIMVEAQGQWVYQFTSMQKQALTKLIAGKKKDEAQSILLMQTGIAQVTIQLSGGDGVRLPTDASKITINVNNATG